MGHSVKVTIKCNQKCKYCYEKNAREENASAGEQEGYSVDKIIEFISGMPVKKQKNGMTNAPNLHGGEPLLLPKARVEELFSYIFGKFGETSIQTNGSMIDADHIEMFKKYNTSVGVSIDGHEELNDGRWMGSVDKTRRNTAKIIENIKLMRQEKVKVSIIAVVNKYNGTRDRIAKLKEFLLIMKEHGILGGRLNMIELDFPELAGELQIPMDEEINFYKEMAPFLRENGLRYAPFTDAVDSLLGFGHKTCVTARCDPWHTLGEQPIYGDGTEGNCLRTTKDGVVFLAEKGMYEDGQRVSNERYVILKQIPMDEGGCQGCKFWAQCSAHCPGSAIDGDWRNKAEHCQSIYSLFDVTEKTLKQTMPGIKLTSDNGAGTTDDMFHKIQSGKASKEIFDAFVERGSAF